MQAAVVALILTVGAQAFGAPVPATVPRPLRCNYLVSATDHKNTKEQIIAGSFATKTGRVRGQAQSWYGEANTYTVPNFLIRFVSDKEADFFLLERDPSEYVDIAINTPESRIGFHPLTSRERLIARTAGDASILRFSYEKTVSGSSHRYEFTCRK